MIEKELIEKALGMTEKEIEKLKFEENQRLYKPSEVVMKLAESYGQILTPSVIRKYDNEDLFDLVEPREPNAKRLYSNYEIVHFLIIAVLRSLGYSLKEIKRKLVARGRNDSEGLDADGVLSRIERQRKSFDQVYNIFVIEKVGILRKAAKG